MAPSIAETTQETNQVSHEAPSKIVPQNTTTASSPAVKPLKYSGSLDQYKSFDVTNVIGREYPEVRLLDILKDDQKIRDLAITVSQRGVVFFRNQDISVEDQKTLGQKLGELTGKPASSKLHRHALLNSKRGLTVDENGKQLDDEISIISSQQFQKFYKERFSPGTKRIASEGWHADITFEHVPSDYAILKIHTLPDDVGGDTLWASGYEVYDRLSPTWQKIAENLTATHQNPEFLRVVAEHGVDLITEDRGSPENKGLEFSAQHPVVRTNPVTGWKSIFGAGAQIAHGHIDNVTERESELIKAYFLELIAKNHDLQVRFKWNKNDVAIWDNRSVFHTATNDYGGKRQGNRVVSIGEKPYFDPNSVSRRETLFGTA
ncbi:putative TfdA family taurine dioxygenase [Stipitochalara longipes BDJ]|nr:putative TfdA family taurine dioxygenase [Stipitochalara longipes BDJ]